MHAMPPNSFSEKRAVKPHVGHNGFTLIELLVAMAFLVGITAIAIPTINSMADRYSGNRAVHELISELHVARTLAIRHGENSTISFDDPNPGQYTVTWDSPQQSRIGDLTRFRNGIQTNNAPPNPPDPPAALITFAPTGLATVWGNVYVTDAENSEDICIEVTLAGAISERIYNPNTNQWDYR